MGVGRVQDAADVVNLLTEWPGHNTWPVKLARFRADVLLTVHDHRVWLLCGQRVARAFRLQAPILTWTEHRDRLVAVVPHPSGRCRFWNDPAGVDRARAFFADLEEPAWS